MNSKGSPLDGDEKTVDIDLNPHEEIKITDQ
jgi:hypothetical protein